MNNGVLSSYGWFKYKWRTFKPDTIVKFNKDWLVAHGYSLYSDVNYMGKEFHYGPCIYGKFRAGYPDKPCYFIRAKSPESFNKAEYNFMISDQFIHEVLEEAIEEVLGVDEYIHWETLCDNNSENGSYGKLKKDWNQVPEVKIMLVIYIILMIASLIFKEPWGAWIVLTVGFIILSNKMINDANGNGGPY
jgi:hypothetical protein